MSRRPLLLLLILAALPVAAAAAPCFADLSPADVAARLEGMGEEPVILDVRTPGEFVGRDGHIEGALLVPLDQLEETLPKLRPLADREVIVVCHSGNRSSVASRMLCGAGFTQVANLDGGMSRWRRSGLPVVRD
jgi:rhodanese-related sulfurtransferase